MPAATSLEDIYHNTLLSDEQLTGCCNSLSSSYSPSTSTLAGEQSQFCSGRDELCEDYIFQKLLQLAATRTKNSNTINCDVLNYSHNSNSISTTTTTPTRTHHNHHKQQRLAQQAHPLDDHHCATGRLQSRLPRHLTMHSNRKLLGAAAKTSQQQQQQSKSKLQQQQQHQQHQYQPTIFFYHDDDLSTSSAPDSFPEHQQLGAPVASQPYLTIEELKSALNSCWLCGCNWAQEHLSLDCPECGGYSLTRPCLKCDGKCERRWQRNINATHDRHKALWVGECQFEEAERRGQATASSSGSSSGASALESLKLSPAPLASSICSSAPTSSSESDDAEEDERSRQLFKGDKRRSSRYQGNLTMDK